MPTLKVLMSFWGGYIVLILMEVYLCMYHKSQEFLFYEEISL